VTVQQIIDSALRKIGVLAEGETSEYQASADALECLNDLVDQWAAEDLFIYAIVNTTWTIVANQPSYTVGTGGNVNIARPVYVQHVNYIDTAPAPDLELPLQELTDDMWAAIPQKALTNPQPTAYYFLPSFPLATLYLWPIPTSSTLQGSIYAKTAITEFSALTDTFTLPPAYRRMIRSNLALELAPEYGSQPDPMLVKAAAESKLAVTRANGRLVDLGFDLGLPGAYGNGRWWSINVGP
jgi:hypothetical protein